MPYSCQFCGDIEEAEVVLHCNACKGEKVIRGMFGSRCADCDTNDALIASCPTCGSEELEQ